MAKISKQQLKEMMKEAESAGIDKKSFVKTLIRDGNTLEGYSPSKTRPKKGMSDLAGEKTRTQMAEFNARNQGIALNAMKDTSIGRLLGGIGKRAEVERRFKETATPSEIAAQRMKTGFEQLTEKGASFKERAKGLLGIAKQTPSVLFGTVEEGVKDIIVGTEEKFKQEMSEVGPAIQRGSIGQFRGVTSLLSALISPLTETLETAAETLVPMAAKGVYKASGVRQAVSFLTGLSQDEVDQGLKQAAGTVIKAGDEVYQGLPQWGKDLVDIGGDLVDIADVAVFSAIFRKPLSTAAKEIATLSRKELAATQKALRKKIREKETKRAEELLTKKETIETSITQPKKILSFDESVRANKALEKYGEEISKGVKGDSIQELKMASANTKKIINQNKAELDAIVDQPLAPKISGDMPIAKAQSRLDAELSKTRPNEKRVKALEILLKEETDFAQGKIFTPKQGLEIKRGLDADVPYRGVRFDELSTTQALQRQMAKEKADIWRETLNDIIGHTQAPSGLTFRELNNDISGLIDLDESFTSQFLKLSKKGVPTSAEQLQSVFSMNLGALTKRFGLTGAGLYAGGPIGAVFGEAISFFLRKMASSSASLSSKIKNITKLANNIKKLESKNAPLKFVDVKALLPRDVSTKDLEELKKFFRKDETLQLPPPGETSYKQSVIELPEEGVLERSAGSATF